MVVLERVAADAIISGRFNASSFFAACMLAGLDISTLIAYYHGKNILNMFRQEHGYKTGGYIKNWGTEKEPSEDNVYLAEQIEEYRKVQGPNGMLRSINAGTFSNYLRNALHRRYTELTHPED
jgi:hypothetical protein